MRRYVPTELPFSEDESPFLLEGLMEAEQLGVASPTSTARMGSAAAVPGILDLVRPIWSRLSDVVRRRLERAAVRQAMDSGVRDVDALTELVMKARKAARNETGAVARHGPEWLDIRDKIVVVVLTGRRRRARRGGARGSA